MAEASTISKYYTREARRKWRCVVVVGHKRAHDDYDDGDYGGNGRGVKEGEGISAAVANYTLWKVERTARHCAQQQTLTHDDDDDDW